MKTNKCKYLLSLLLTFCLLASTTSAANLNNIPVQPRFITLSILEAHLDVSFSGLSQSNCIVKPSNASYTVMLTLELQRGGGTSFSTIKSWEDSGSGTVTLDQSWYVSRGYEYRVYVTARVYNSSGSLVETATTVSDTVFY